MVLSTPGVRMAALGALLFILLASSVPAGAQVPSLPDTSNPERSALAFAVVCKDSLILVAYNGAGDTICRVMDLSKDSGSVEGASGGAAVLPHNVQLTVNGTIPFGWQVTIGQSFIPIRGGQVIEVPLTVKTTPQLTDSAIDFVIDAVYTGPNGYTDNLTLAFAAKVKDYDIAYASILNQVQKAGQDEIVRYVIQITNFGVYPDVYEVTIRSTDGFAVTSPPRVYVPPGETRNVTFSVLTPQGKLYEFGKNAQFSVKVISTQGSGVYVATGLLTVRGSYIPVYWIPLTIVGLISAVIVSRGTRENRELKKLERGRPRRVQPTPRQAVLLAELKRRDPDAYLEKKAQLDAVYAARVETFRSTRKERLAREREEHKASKAEMAEEERRIEERRKADKAQRKLDRKEEKRQRKLDRKEQKVVEAKLKTLNKKKAKIEKKQAKIDAKQAKKDAKVAAKQAKIDAKEAAAEAKRAKAEARIEAKRLKAEERARKKSQ